MDRADTRRVGSGRRQQAASCISLAERVIETVRAGQRPDLGELRWLSAWGLGYQVDCEIRRCDRGTGAWASIALQDVDRLVSDAAAIELVSDAAAIEPVRLDTVRSALLVLLGCHPVGEIRAAAVELVGDGYLHVGGGRPG